MNKEEKKTIEDMNRFANGIDMSCVTARQMQVILNLIERLQKENEELKNDYENLNNSVVVKKHYIKNSIPVQKVKDKIEQLKEKGESNLRSYGFAVETHLALQALQELLEGREEKTNGKNL